MLKETDTSRGLVGKNVDTYAFIDGRFEVRWKGQSLPHSIFDMDQRVTHAAVVENKRLSAVLAHVKEAQDNEPPKYPVRTKSEKMGYKPKGTKSKGPKSFVDKLAEKKAAATIQEKLHV